MNKDQLPPLPACLWARNGRAHCDVNPAQAGEVTPEQIDDIVDRASEAVGMCPGAWDMVKPRELVRAILALVSPVKAITPEFEVDHVGDTRFESWLGCHEPDRNVGRALRYSKQDLRDSYWAGYCEGRALRPQAVPMTLPSVEGDVLPAIGSTVLIHLASSDSWAEHEVVGYYVWEAINELAKPRHHRVFVRVRDNDGILNARMLCDVRGILPQAEGGK